MYKKTSEVNKNILKAGLKPQIRAVYGETSFMEQR